MHDQDWLPIQVQDAGPLPGGWRAEVAVVVAADSPAGLVAEAIDAVTRHLPPTSQATGCPLCPGREWPCAPFNQAAAQVLAAGLRLADFVCLDLHRRLWPAPPPRPPVSAPSWFDVEGDGGE